MRVMIMAMLLSVTVPLIVLAQTADELRHDEKTPGDVLTYGMGYSQHRYSPLAHINRDNVKRLVPAWSYSMADNRGQEAQPLVKDGVIYLTDHEKTVAIDALSGKQIWKALLGKVLMTMLLVNTRCIECLRTVNADQGAEHVCLFKVNLDQVG